MKLLWQIEITRGEIYSIELYECADSMPDGLFGVRELMCNDPTILVSCCAQDKAEAVAIAYARWELFSSPYPPRHFTMSPEPPHS